ncbi:MAG: hypothetical protein M5T61_17525 [Acidimicrobiia bacterium]|nr:hypothetical protein [Acidimicrobiia bacterium]
MTDQQYQYVDERTIRDRGGIEHDVLEAVDQLPWVRQLCPFMPHEYAILSRSAEQPWYVVEAMIRLSPASYRAFFPRIPSRESLLGSARRTSLLALALRAKPMGFERR